MTTADRLIDAAKIAKRAEALAANHPRPSGSNAERLYLELACLTALLDSMVRRARQGE